MRVSVGPNPMSTCMLKLSVVSQTDVVVKPNQIVFGTVERGQTPTQTINVEYNGTRDWKIEEVIVAEALPVEAVLAEVVRRPGRVGYQLKVTLNDDAPPGIIRDYLYLKTNHADVPPAPVLVAATVQRPERGAERSPTGHGDARRTADTTRFGEGNQAVPRHSRRRTRRGHRAGRRTDRGCCHAPEGDFPLRVQHDRRA